VTIRAHTEVTALSGGSTLQRITLTDNTTGLAHTIFGASGQYRTRSSVRRWV
jgi:hypothetical protein